MADGQERVTGGGYGAVGGQYDRQRPGYPPEVLDRIEQVALLPAAAEALEIGIGTGQATRLLLERGHHVTGVEPDGLLVDLARERLAAFEDRLTLHHARFESLRLPAEAFDLVLAATSWHWLDPDVAPQLVADALRPGGTVALVWNAHTDRPGDPFATARRRIYRDVAPHLERLAPLHPGDPEYDPAASLDRSGRFGPVEVWRHEHRKTYTASDYLALLDTYASHRDLAPDARRELHARLRACIDRDFDGSVTIAYDARAYTARRSRA